jgi:hypothetical protein
VIVNAHRLAAAKPVIVSRIALRMGRNLLDEA